MDPTTSVGNSLGFFEWFIQWQKLSSREDFSVLFVHIDGNGDFLDKSKPDSEDQLVHWLSQTLIDETQSKIFRLGTYEFIGLFLDGPNEFHETKARSFFARLERECAEINLHHPIARGVLIHSQRDYMATQHDVYDLLQTASDFSKADSSEILTILDRPNRYPQRNLNWLIRNISQELIDLGEKLDDSHRMANSDPLTELPNSRAAMSELELIHAQSHRAGRKFTILFIDGDNLRQYNEISYAAGDEMIQKLSAVKRNALRGRDFLARWRLGDEFVVILPDTPLEQALGIAERLRYAVESESSEWLIPVTISIGAAEYPGHADSIMSLLHEAEEAKNQAKLAGKNQVVVASTVGTRMN
jgi:diguanylate cyclase (GGDEF)-like protein